MFSHKGFLAAALAAAMALGAEAQSVYLVQISDMAKRDGYEVMTREEVAALKKAIAEETKAYPAALAAVKKAWDADELTRKIYFPAAKLAPRKMREQGPFPQEQALKKKEKAMEPLDDALFKEAAASKKKGGGKSDAAKEAAAKMLGTGIWRHDIGWTDIEVVRDPVSGAPSLVFHHAAAAWTQQIGLREWSISLSHDRTHAIAFVVGMGGR